jgi:DNA-binding LytR/AlgR family response regulator
MKIGIVEDVQADRDLLESLLKQYIVQENLRGEFRIFSNSTDFLAEWPFPLDLAFLDIQMDGVNGVELAGRIRKHNDHTVIIFITNNPQYSLSGYSVDALDYLIKPPTSDVINQLLPRAIRRLGDMDRARITIRNTDGIFVINLCDVNYLELEKRRILVHTINGCVSFLGSMQSLVNQLPDNFFRCHTSFIVNLSAVQCLKGQDIVVAGTSIPISKHRRKEFLNALTDCMGDAI